MRKLAAVLVLIASASVSEAQVTGKSEPPGFPESKKFSVVIERNGTEWKARCELGCAWTGVTLGFTCKGACDAIVDADGFVAAKTGRDPNSPFSFALSALADGSIVVKKRTGMVWLQLGWSCRSDPCTALVNEFGVANGRPPLEKLLPGS